MTAKKSANPAKKTQEKSANPAKKEVIILKCFAHGRKIYSPGEKLQFENTLAEHIIKSGLAK